MEPVRFEVETPEWLQTWYGYISPDQAVTFTSVGEQIGIKGAGSLVRVPGTIDKLSQD